MRKPFQKLFFLLGVLLVASPIVALADEVTDDLDTPQKWSLKNLRVGAAKLRTSLANDPDTVWIGHIADPGYVPLDRNGAPVPSSARDANGAPTVAGTVPVGGYGPHHVGRGLNQPGGDVSANPDVLGGANTDFNGIWDFDHYQAGDDSLQGWWPVARPGQSEGAGNPDDKTRGFFGLNYGNQGNYVMNMGSNKRTFGVTGYWHRDIGSTAPNTYVDGTPAIPGPNVEWAPITGTASAWCGLRAEADLNARDDVSRGGTGNYYNSSVLAYNGNNSFNQTGAVNAQDGTDKNFPGVGSQWDQLLYRDVNLSAVPVGGTVTISFDYVHALSRTRGGTDLQRVGYFWKDPVRPTKGVVNDGNYVSATECFTAGTLPSDSFTVTLGQPVDIVPDDPPVIDGVPVPANDFAASSAAGGTPNMNIFDPQRRWFSEVINTGGTGGAPMVELLARTRFSDGAGGEKDPSAVVPGGAPATNAFSTTLTRTAGSSLDALIGSNGGRVRLVFRVLTNRGHDDEDYFVSGFTSHTRGGAIIDNVSITAGGPNLITEGGFEGAAAVDNTVNGVYSNLSENSTTITSAVANAYAAIAVGATVTGQDISAGTTVAAKPNNSTITLSAPVRNTLDLLTSQVGTGQRYVYFNMSTALASWKSTGKPPGVYAHVHCINTNCASAALWNDPCSPPNLLDAKASNRLCNMVGNILSGGDHDFAEKPGGQFGANDQDRQRLAVSPTIIIATDQGNANNYNAMGLNKDIVAASTEWALFFDIHTAGFRGSGGNGNLRSIGLQNYPARQANGAFGWGEANFSTAITFNTANACNQNFISLKQAGFIKTSNATGVPDSVRVHFQYISRCYTTALTAVTCSPTSGTQVGNYIDNLSFSLFNGIVLAGLSNFPWMMFVDAFPTYEASLGVPRTIFTAASFDTAAGKVKSAINRHTNTTSTARPSVPGDSAQVTSGAFPSFGRLDLVFRILPGPGNYTTAGNRLSAIKQVPTSGTAATGAAGSTNFWENYMANTGSFGTGGLGGPTLPVTAVNINTENGGVPHDPDGAGPIAPGTRWDWNAWNSARMDTLERNLWPSLASSTNLAQTSGGSDWQTTYHELDPRFGTLGTAKNRCFLANPALTATCKSKTPASTTDCNLVCELLPGAAPFGVYPPAWAVPAGYPGGGEGAGLALGQTREFTKIIPDGQLTAGSHVQYFFRRFPGLNQAIDIWPDTTQIFDGPTADGGRWYNFSILPDRWKDAAWGEGLLCMLVVDNYDRQGDEFFWVSAADSIGLTSTQKRGAQNGWFAAGGQNLAGQFNLATMRRDNGGQPGSLWDLWNTKAGESITTGAAWLANRTTSGLPVGSFAEGKGNTTGAYSELLQNFYKAIIWLTGTGNAYIYGSVQDRGDDEILLMNNYISGPSTRALLAWGSGFSENMTGAAGGPVPAGGGAGHLAGFWGASLLSPDYRSDSGNLAPISTYSEVPGQPHDLAGAQSGLSYGMIDGCGIQNDILDDLPSAAAPGASIQTTHQNMGQPAFGIYGASVYVPSNGPAGSHPAITHLDGTRVNRAVTYPPTPPGPKKHFLYSVLKNIAITAGAVACSPLASPVAVGDDPSTGSSFVNFLKLRSSNPMHSGEARLAFGLAKSEKVEVRVFDVTGRSVKTVANRVFAGGKEHVVVWDGTDEAGNRVKAGVYFYQLKTPTWVSQKKLAVLSN